MTKQFLSKRLFALVLSLAMILGMLPVASLTVQATEYSSSVSANLQPGDILKPGARITAESITVNLQANGWGYESVVSDSDKQISVGWRGLEISEYENGAIQDSEYNYYYPYANGEKVSAWEVVSAEYGEDPWTQLPSH